MDPVKIINRGQHSINTGSHQQYDINLELGKGYQGGPIFMDVLGFTTAAVTVKAVQATGTSGSALIKQSQDAGSGELFDLETPATVDFTENETKGAFDLKVSGHFLVLDLSGVTFGTAGRVYIDIVAKR